MTSYLHRINNSAICPDISLMSMPLKGIAVKVTWHELRFGHDVAIQYLCTFFLCLPCCCRFSWSGSFWFWSERWVCLSASLWFHVQLCSVDLNNRFHAMVKSHPLYWRNLWTNKYWQVRGERQKLRVSWQKELHFGMMTGHGCCTVSY